MVSIRVRVIRVGTSANESSFSNRIKDTRQKGTTFSWKQLIKYSFSYPGCVSGSCSQHFAWARRWRRFSQYDTEARSCYPCSYARVSHSDPPRVPQIFSQFSLEDGNRLRWHSCQPSDFFSASGLQHYRGYAWPPERLHRETNFRFFQRQIFNIRWSWSNVGHGFRPRYSKSGQTPHYASTSKL